MTLFKTWKMVKIAPVSILANITIEIGSILLSNITILAIIELMNTPYIASRDERRCLYCNENLETNMKVI